MEIAESYLDVWGHEKRIDAETREALAKALGPPRRPAKVKLDPGRCHEPELLAQGGRVWGFMVQLYGLRSNLMASPRSSAAHDRWHTGPPRGRRSPFRSHRHTTPGTGAPPGAAPGLTGSGQGECRVD